MRGLARARRPLFAGVILASLLVADAVQEILPGGGVFLVLLIPVLLGAATLGTAPAATALVVGALGAVVLVTLRGHPWLSEPSDLWRLALYGVEGVTMIAIARVSRGPASGRSAPRSEQDQAPRKRPPSALRLIEPLTRREEEVLRLVAAGHGTDEVGTRLSMSRNTVKSHLRHAYGKVGAHNRAEAIAACLHLGYIDLAELPGPAPYLAVRDTQRDARSGAGRRTQYAD